MNNEMRFDTQTGEPIHQNAELQQIQANPTVEQSKEEFINNTQNISQEIVEEKTSVNYFFIIVLFVILMASIFFLFPILIKYI